MRTFLWCAATAALAVGGTYWATEYGHRNPQSFLGHCVEQSACGCRAVEFTLPDEPMPIGEEPSSTADAGLNAVVQLPPPEVLPIPVVIPDEDERQEDEGIPLPLGDTRMEDGGFFVTSGPFNSFKGGNDQEVYCPIPEVQPVSLFMPYCVDDAPRMPYADDDEKGCCEELTEQEAAEATDRFLRFWLNLFSNGEPGTAEESEPAGKSDCKEDPNRHEQYPGLPFTGGVRNPVRPATPPPAFLPLLPEPTPRKSKPADEIYEKGSSKAEPSLGRPCVDTMEFRPSDARANEFRIGPL
jgi:hypothetical protein